MTELEEIQKVELGYLREENKELNAIVRQLTNWNYVKGQPIYIHPFDLMEMCHNVVDSKLDIDSKHPTNPTIFRVLGVDYKQSVNIPPRTKNIV